MNKKVYKNIEEQINHLVTKKNVVKSTIERDYLIDFSYMNVVNPFTDLIAIGRGRNAEHLYEENLNFNIFINLYNIDRLISINLRELICEFELTLKSFLSDIYSSKMNEFDKSCSDYEPFKQYELSNNLYDCMDFNKSIDKNGNICEADEFIIDKRRKLIEKLISGVNQKNNNPLLSHYSNNGYIPFWIIIRTLTINELLTLFMILNKEDKLLFIKKINKSKIHYNNRDVYRICQKFYLIGKIRNVVNHYEPITPLILTFKNKSINSLTDTIKLLKNNCNFKIEIIPLLVTENNYNRENLNKLKKIIETFH